MPIKHDFPVRILSQDEFHAIDRTVMRFSFDIQNELGRFYDECIYQKELAFRCQCGGLEVLLEPPVRAVHGDFEKRYFLDMLINHGAVYELKAVEDLMGIHETQLINYLLLLRLHHGKMNDLIADWGAFLDAGLYEEALIHFTGGASERIRHIDVNIAGRVIGSQKVCLLQDDTSLHVTAIKQHKNSYQKHLKRLFDHTSLSRIQWINFNRSRIEMVTLKK
jgi:GxxExxY protein